MNFTAIDFETATAKRFSICQVGLVRVENGNISNVLSIRIKPPNNEYSKWNMMITGLSPSDTVNAPTFHEIWDEIRQYIENNLIVAHNAAFDVDCLVKTLEYYKIPIPYFEVDCTYQKTNLSLEALCEALDVELRNHHDAEHDALACAHAYIKLSNNIPLDISKITQKKKAPTFQWKGHEQLKGDVLKPDLEHGDPESPFYGKKVVFTGALKSINRKIAAKIIRGLGADIDTIISKRTNFVILGVDPGPSKMKKIKALHNEGFNIKIIREKEFLEMIS